MEDYFMNRLNKFVKSFLVASLSLAFLMPNAAITSNAAVNIGEEVSKYGVTGNSTSNILLETGTKDYIMSLSGYKISVKSSSSNLKLFKRTSTYNSYKTESNSKYVDKSDCESYVNVYGYAKKAGTYKVTYTVKDINGSVVTPTQTLTVVAKDDVSPFKKITYAGKSLWDNEGSRFYGLTDTTVYTTKAKGKLVVKPASGYKIKKIEIGSYNVLADETDTETEEGYRTETTTTTSNKSTSIKYTNKYGNTSEYDKYDEYGNKITGEMTFKKVKSGKKISLGTVKKTYTETSKSVYTESTYTSTSVYDSSDLLPATTVRVTYYDKTTKKTFQWETNIILAK